MQNTSENAICQRLCDCLRLLERDEWILLNKDHQNALKWANDKQGTLLWCKKGLGRLLRHHLGALLLCSRCLAKRR